MNADRPVLRLLERPPRLPPAPPPPPRLRERLASWWHRLAQR